MSLISPPEYPVCCEKSTDVKADGDFPSDPDKVDQSTVLIAALQEDEPVVTKKELWSYYRASFLTSFRLYVYRPGRSLLQRRQCKSLLILVLFLTSIPSHRLSVL